MFRKLLNALPLKGALTHTGVIVTIAGVILQQSGMNQDEATQTVSLCMQGIGGVTALVGWIRKLMNKGKTADLAKK